MALTNDQLAQLILERLDEIAGNLPKKAPPPDLNSPPRTSPPLSATEMSRLDATVAYMVLNHLGAALNALTTSLKNHADALRKGPGAGP
jgi:hypothetical protein